MIDKFIELKHYFWHIITIIFSVIICHGLSLRNAFKGDDFRYLNVNYALDFTSIWQFFVKAPAHHYNPIDKIFNTILFSSLPLDPFWFRVVNLGLLLLCAVVFYFFLFKLIKKSNVSLLATILFIAHPFTAEIVEQITLNIVLINGILTLVCLTFYQKFLTNKNKIYYGLTILTYVIGLLSFEGSIMFFVVIFGLDYFSNKKYFLKQSLARTLPFLVISIIYFLMWKSLVQDTFVLSEKIGHLAITPVEYIKTYIHLLAWYFSSFFNPGEIVFIYNLDPKNLSFSLINFIISISFVASLIFICIKYRRSLASYFVLWFAAGLVLVFPASLAHTYMGMVIEPNWFFAYNMGIYALVAYGLVNVSSKIKGSIYKILIIGVFGYLFIFSQWQHVVGRSPYSYALNWLKVCPNNYLALKTLASEHSSVGDYKMARFYLEKILKINIISFDIVYSYGSILVQEGKDVELGEAYLKEAIRMNGECFACYNSLAIIEKDREHNDNAEKYYLKALELNPYFNLARINLADFYNWIGKGNKALEQYQYILNVSKNKQFQDEARIKSDRLLRRKDAL
ncbi:MAG: tetratricopeptide (TPR) repeat protein [Lysobacterales bacterium]|jgi:tetratricopeptide (TPR) repeat protein